MILTLAKAHAITTPLCSERPIAMLRMVVATALPPLRLSKASSAKQANTTCAGDEVCTDEKCWDTEIQMNICIALNSGFTEVHAVDGTLTGTAVVSNQGVVGLS